MAREQYKTPDADVAAEFERVCHLFRLAMGKPSERVLFDSLMTEASDQGMNWVEGLQYVIQRRDAAAEGPRRGVCSVPVEINASSHLRRAS